MAANPTYTQCPNCGHSNPPTARICENCMSVLVEPAPPPSQVGAIHPPDPHPVPPPQVEPQLPPVQPVIPVMPPDGPVSPPTLAEKRAETHRFSDDLRAIALRATKKETDGEKREFWEDPKLLMTAFSFVAMVGKRVGLFGSDSDDKSRDDSRSHERMSYSEEEAKQEPYSTKSYDETTEYRKQKPYSKP